MQGMQPISVNTDKKVLLHAFFANASEHPTRKVEERKCHRIGCEEVPIKIHVPSLPLSGSIKEMLDT